MPSFDACLDRMGEAHGRIDNGVVVSRSELGRREELEAVCIQQNLLRNDLLKEFPTALQKRDGAVGFPDMIVGFVGLQDRDDLGVAPWMVAQCDRRIE